MDLEPWWLMLAGTLAGILSMLLLWDAGLLSALNCLSNFVSATRENC